MTTTNSRHDFLVFGAAGIQGRIVVRDLVERGYRVFASDLFESDVERLCGRHRGLEGRALDLNQTEDLRSLVASVRPSVIINCAEMDWNLTVAHTALESGSHVVDLGSDIEMVAKQIAMHEAFAEKGLIAIAGCGSTPGITDVMLEFAAEQLDRLERVEVGFVWDSNEQTFVVPFSMDTIISEFLDPAAFVHQDQWMTVRPMESVRRRKFKGIENQRCFAAPHEEVYTYYHFYRDRGLRSVRFSSGFPDHSFDRITKLCASLDERGNVHLDEGPVHRSRLTRALERRHPMPDQYIERENLWVIVDGTVGAVPRRIRMECLVPPIAGWESAGCNVDTGFPASIIGQMILNGDIGARGSFSPGPVVPWRAFFEELERRGLRIYRDGRPWYIDQPISDVARRSWPVYV